jgi:hypothetical protein
MKVNLSHSLPLVKHFGELHLRIASGKAEKIFDTRGFSAHCYKYFHGKNLSKTRSGKGCYPWPIN